MTCDDRIWMQADRQSASNRWLALQLMHSGLLGSDDTQRCQFWCYDDSSLFEYPRLDLHTPDSQQINRRAKVVLLTYALRHAPPSADGFILTDDPSIGAPIMAVLKGTDPTASGERPGTHPTAKAVPIPLQARPQPEVPVQLCREQRRYGALLKS
jgi:hypothetical protein